MPLKQYWQSFKYIVVPVLEPVEPPLPNKICCENYRLPFCCLCRVSLFGVLAQEHYRYWLYRADIIYPQRSAVCHECLMHHYGCRGEISVGTRSYGELALCSLASRKRREMATGFPSCDPHRFAAMMARFGPYARGVGSSWRTTASIVASALEFVVRL